MKKRFEKTYGSTVRGLMFAVNPLKKKIMKTHCTVHKFINIKAINMLSNEGYTEQYDFFKGHVKPLNDGVTWADQDFKSSNHFYHYAEGKGLYGFSDALTECKKYYQKSLHSIAAKDINKALFYFGAACHLVQDTTVPQHVSNRLLESHRGFELWIIGKFMSDYSFEAETGLYRCGDVEKYIKNNSIMAMNTYRKYKDIEDREDRYWNIATTIIKEAQRSTAGFMLDFYDKIKQNV